MSKKEGLRLKFARNLGLAINDSPGLRSFLKEEALKKFNRDYDVFYPMVKDSYVARGGPQVLKSNSSTLRSLLLEYYEDESELIEIENELPLLTIFVPELPEGSFSAKSWDTKDPDQIPVVAVRLDNTNEVPMVDVANDFEYVLEPELIPGYPVVVVKDNERISTNTTDNNFSNSTIIFISTT